MIKMRSFLLFLLSLMTGYQAKSEGKGCQQGWVEFTCKYPEPNGKDTNIDADDPTQTNTHSSEKDDWEIKGSFSLFYETKDKKVRVAIKQLEHEDFGVDRCTCSQLECVTDTEEPDQGDGKHGCQTPFVQTAYRTAKTTITCDYPGNTHQSSVKDFCKDSDLICEDILSTKSSPGSKAKFTLTETSSGFNVSISDVSSQDAGVYWCGVESNEGPYRATLRKIQLQVKDITTFSRSPTAGKDFTYWCQYPNKALTKKFICKGEDPSICQRQASTEPLKENTKFSMRDDKEKRNITITVREVTTDDTGTYWCGAESNYPGRSNLFFHKFSMTVSSTPVPTSSVSSTQSTASASAESHGGSQVITTVIICVAALLLLFVLILILTYKRFSHSKRRDGATAQQVREDHVYEEMQECVQMPDSGNAVNTIYATANFPTNPSASLCYSTINFQDTNNKAGGEALNLKPRSACEYSTVKHSPSQTCSTVNEPSRSLQDPLYSTVNKTEQR
ncbi:uncharacterized protein LOC121624125 isoform X3 [Chelmon rostratus]|uniref:uncharacterized protein LOC121624125 isoform X3 n=1 Tax=Chelmon rostratus TaxID=109905 RepID=UPI001BEA75D4|nr:uncharacterized protein LOC121624125 isoform X3 [Chelmon rostratus]